MHIIYKSTLETDVLVNNDSTVPDNVTDDANIVSSNNISFNLRENEGEKSITPTLKIVCTIPVTVAECVVFQ